MTDTLKYLNDFQLSSGSLGLDKTYTSISAMNADTEPVSDITGKPLKAGQLAVIVPTAESDPDAGKVYRYNSPGDWTYIQTIGNIIADKELSETSENPIQNSTVTRLVTEYNVSNHFPTDGIDGTNRYTLETAIAKIPESLRTVGIKCSFLNEGGQMETWEYHGGAYLTAASWIRSDISAVNEKIDSQKAEVDAAKNEAMAAISGREQEVIDNFNAQRVTPEMLSEATKQFINASGGGTVTNLPDDEDITSTGGDTPVLKFKDRTYNPENFSGKGYAILRKNISNGKNILTQEMINNANTVYVLRYDFDLNGATINIPANCILDFQGGSMSNGTVSGNNSLITGYLKDIFHLPIKGSWLNSECNPIWWGAVGVDGTDDSIAIQYSFDCPIPVVRITDRFYISKPVSLPYNKMIIGRTGNNNKLTGFYANPDFSSLNVDFPARGGKDAFSQVVKGMFYHRDTTKSEMHDIFMDARHYADYCVEHIDLYGSIDFYNCYVCGANYIGILQYACENPIIQQLYINDCHVGLYVSTTKVNDANIFDFSGVNMGSPNILNFDSLRILKCNYGLILNKCSNSNLNNLETAYNAIVGVYLNEGTHEINNYYTEGDAICNFWIDRNGNMSKTENYGIALQCLIDNNLDGFPTRGKDPDFDEIIYYRAPVVLNRASVLINSAFLSVKPRSTYVSDPTEITMPNNRSVGGIDAFVLLVEQSSLTAKNLSPYIYINNKGVLPYRSIIQSHSLSYTPNSKLDVEFRGDWPTLKTACPQSPGGTSVAFQIPNNNHNNGNFNLHVRPNNYYNADIETPRYGTLHDFDFRENIFAEMFNNIPLYKISDKGKNQRSIYISKEDFEKKFKAGTQIKVIVYVKILKDLDSERINLSYAFLKTTSSPWETIASGGINQMGNEKYYQGYYRYVLIFGVSPGKQGYDTVQLTLTSNNIADILFSDMFIYDIEDYEEKPYIYKNVFLPAGSTGKRPGVPVVGQRYFDTTLSKPIWWDGSKWVDSMGNAV